MISRLADLAQRRLRAHALCTGQNDSTAHWQYSWCAGSARKNSSMSDGCSFLAIANDAEVPKTFSLRYLGAADPIRTVGAGAVEALGIRWLSSGAGRAGIFPLKQARR